MRHIAVALFFALSLSAQPEHLLLRRPALNRTQIVFSYAGDLWSVPRQGGEARRLTAGPGVETDPVFSPDGSQIAFTGEYDGNVDVFVLPSEGGVPRRLTWHPQPDAAVGWTPDGKRILFESSRDIPYDGARLFTVPAEGGFPEELPLPIAFEGSFSPDGSHLAYVPVFQWQEAWKRYRGGQTRKIWIADLATSSTIAIPRENSNDFNPMWVGDQVYFLSDRNGPVSLFAYDVPTRKVRQVVENHGLDFKSASAGPGAIVYEQFGALYLYDLKTGKSSAVNVRLAGDLPEVRPHFVNVAGRLHNPDLSPTGARAVFEARGEILTVPAEKGVARNLTNSVAAMDRSPVWSPDGQSIAYFSDESGEYMLHIRNQDGMGEVKKIALGDKPDFYYALQWSPDSKKIAYNDCHNRIYYIDLEEKKPVLVDQGYYMEGDGFMARWSPDSKWLTYAKQQKSHMGAINVYSLGDAKSTQVTDGMSDAQSPVFDKEGKYLYFVASTNSGPALQPDIEGFSHPVTFSVYLMVLSKDSASPLAPESDDEKKEAKKDDSKKDDSGKDEAKKDDKDKGKDKDKEKAGETPAVKIDFENIGQRILAVPLPARRYVGLQVGKAGMIYAVVASAPGPNSPSTFNVGRYDLNKRKADIAVSGVKQFQVSFNGEKMLYLKDGAWKIASATDGSNEKTLKTGDLEVRVDPHAEWKQMFHEVWRIERDFFYDPHYHGLDLNAAEERYSVYLNGLGSRDDLNYLFTEMLGNMTVGHMFVGGGDHPDVKHVSTGLLGADYKIENGRYRFARIFNGENWNPDLHAPLTQPGVNAAAGDYLLAVNGREVRGSDEIYSFFEETAGKPVVIKIGPDPAGANAREVTVVPIDDEGRLRHLAWIEDNRRKVDQMTNGRVAYIHMPDTNFGGYDAFMRYFFAQVGKEGAIIDERFNHGGQLATDIIEYLQRKLMSVASFRDGADWMQPQGAIFGPKVMIINQFAGSGGDAMPWYFHRAGVGKLVGERTWGGLVGLTGYPALMDGGTVMAPSAAIWNPNGTFDVENHGVAPDIEVDLDPALVRQGHDPQLEKAVEVVMEELGKEPRAVPQRPASPTYKQ